MKYYVNKHFSRVPVRGYTFCKPLGLLTPIYIQVGMYQKVLALVHQEAANLPAIKVFIVSKSSFLCSKWPDFGVKNTLMAGQFGAP